MTKMNKKGFTIVELVIVIAVIAILAGVLIPTFSGIVNKANDSKALQEAKNIHAEWLSNYNYSDGTTPPDDVIVVVKSDATNGQYVVVKDNQFQKTIHKTKAAAAQAALDGDNVDAVVICAEHTFDKNAQSPTGECVDCGAVCDHGNTAVGSECGICGVTKAAGN